MPKQNGVLNISANFNVDFASPFDSREVVTLYSDLTNPATWENYEYIGMTTAVTEDPDEALRGMYILKALPVTDIANWEKITSSSDVYTLPQATEADLGGVKAKPKTTETKEVAIDVATGKLFVEDSGSGTYTNTDQVVIEVGGVKVGTTFDDVPISDVFDMMFYPELDPALTAPTFNASLSKVITEIGLTENLTINGTFGRGTINPAYGTNGFRSGLPNKYTLDSVDTASTELTFTDTVTANSDTVQKVNFVLAVSYDAGEQPKTSKGNDFGTPLEAGSISRTVGIDFVLPYFANAGNIATVSKQPLSILTNYVEINFPDEDGTNKQVLQIGNAFSVSRITQLNTLSGNWDEIATSSFTVTTTDLDINGVNSTYKVLTHNGGTIGTRKLRFYI